MLIFPTVAQAEPSLDSIMEDLGFSNLISSNLESFPEGTYKITLLAEFGGYHELNSLSYYQVGTEVYQTIFSGIEGATQEGGGFVVPPQSKFVSISYQFGLSMSAQYRYFTETHRNPDSPQQHARIFLNLDSPNMYVICFEDLLGGLDTDYNDMIFSLEQMFPPKIVDVFQSPLNPTLFDVVSISTKVDEGMSALKNVILAYQINDGIWKNVTMDLNGDRFVADISAQSTNTDVNYRIYALDTEGFFDVSAIMSYTVSLIQSSPVASFTSYPEVVYTDEIVTFNATSSYDPDGEVVEYFWDFGDETNATSPIVTHSYLEDGEYFVKLSVYDDSSLSGSQTTTQEVKNRPPIAVLDQSTPSEIDVDQRISLDATESYDPDGSIVSYTWGFGDGTADKGSTVSHTYSDSGFFTLTLTVIDNDGATGELVFLFNVIDDSVPASIEPFAMFSLNGSSITKDNFVHFDGSDSYDSDGEVVEYFWDFGDGQNATGAIVDHQYVSEGTFTVTLTVTDNDGLMSDSLEQINVILSTDSNQDPIALFTKSADTLFIEEVVTFNGSDSYDSDGEVFEYFWDFGDGQNATGAIVDHQYVSEGTFTVTLTVTDDQNASTIESSQIVVEPQSDVSSNNLSIIALIVTILVVAGLSVLFLRRKKRKNK